MKYTVVSVRDTAANAYGRPIFTNSLGQAIRSFQDELNREAQDNVMFHHPEDFNLYHLAEFDEDTGQFTNLPQPMQIGIGNQLHNRTLKGA